MPASQVTWSPAQCMGQPNIDEYTTREIATAYVEGADLERVFMLTREQLLCALAFEATPLGHHPEWDAWYVDWAWPYFAGWRPHLQAWQVPFPPRDEPTTVEIPAARRYIDMARQAAAARGRAT